ncbi:GYF domain-containing protein [Wenxinia marina]|uniref:Sel1 repeat protein n=1 Tax=Wenxinia marina DSM 24838 TaxID=1123501 RepID=A0A0D0QDF4_9RHOB|nr:GYF domain-containing protein [Wenxinia marina]KIQ69033.1 Sel1 repeat protein [Wenxinia marina DSM 24838]GGL69819.1 hypothetical protein GCM10011392_25420 [Wenxinia marina]
MTFLLNRAARAAVLALALGLAAPAVLAQSTMSTTVNGITVTVIGNGNQIMEDSPDGAKVTLNADTVEASPGLVVVNGEEFEVEGPSAVTLDGSGNVVRVLADGAEIWQRSKVDDLRTRAEGGEVNAMGLLAMAYFNGDGVDRDDAEGAAWLTRAAEAGGAEAQSVLAFRYADGLGVPQDYAEARRWAEAAAAQGYSNVYALLGQMLMKGIEGPADPARGIELLTLGAEDGDDLAQMLLGVAYGTGDGVAMDTARAADLYRAAAEQGNMQATRNLAVLAAESAFAIVPRDEAEALLARLEEADHPDAGTLRGMFERAAAPAAAAEAAPETLYYYADGSETVGPMTLPDLRAAQADGRVGPQTWVIEAGQTEWVAAGEFAPLAE